MHCPEFLEPIRASADARADTPGAGFSGSVRSLVGLKSRAAENFAHPYWMARCLAPLSVV